MFLAVPFLLVGLAIGGLVGAIILRAAVAVVNKILGSRSGPESHSSHQSDLDIQQPMLDPTNPYSAPAVAATGRSPGIPEPSFGKAFLIAAVASIVGVVIRGAIGAALGPVVGGDPMLGLAVSVGSLVVNFLFACLIFSKMLPTTLGRAAGVYAAYLGIVLVVGIVILAIVFLARFVFGGAF